MHNILLNNIHDKWKYKCNLFFLTSKIFVFLISCTKKKYIQNVYLFYISNVFHCKYGLTNLLNMTNFINYRISVGILFHE